MKKFLFLFFPFFLLPAVKSFSQAPAILWSQIYTDSWEVWGWDGEMQQTADSGFVFCGTDDQWFQAGIARGLVVKTDAQGDTIWSKHYLYGTACSLRAIREIPGGFIVAGGYSSNNGYRALILKLDASGNVVNWIGYGCFSPFPYTMIDCLQPTSDGGYIFGGQTSCDSLPNESKLIKTDSNLVIQWTQRYGQYGNWGIRSLAEAPGGGYVMAINLVGGAMMLKVDPLGVPLWAKTYGTYVRLTHIELLPDSGYIASGLYDEGNSSMTDSYILRFDSQGDTLWTKRYNMSTMEENCFWIVPVPDGGFFMVGSSYIPSAQVRQVLAMKTDQNGDSLWTKTFTGDPAYTREVGVCCAMSFDTGYVIKGVYSPFIRNNLIKLKDVDNPKGITEDNQPVVSSGPNPFTDELVIDFGTNAGDWQIELFNVPGEIVYSGNSAAQIHRINTKQLPPGLYILRMTNGRLAVSREVLKQ